MSSHSRPFSADVRTVDDVAIIDLHGEINGEADAPLNDAYAQTLADNVATNRLQPVLDGRQRFQPLPGRAASVV